MGYLRSLLRCYLVGACFNTRGLQNVGLTYAMRPGLEVVYADDATGAAKALKRYARHYNSHPFWAPCLVGIFLAVEKLIAQERIPPEMLEKIKNTTSYTLSAIGDSVFAGSLLIFWALSSSCLLVSGLPEAAFSLGVTFFLGLQAFRVYTFLGGLRNGFSFLEKLRAWNLIDWGRRVKVVNAALVLWLWYLLWPKPVQWTGWFAGVATMGLLAHIIQRRGVPRELVAITFLAACLLLPVLSGMLPGILPGLPGK